MNGYDGVLAFGETLAEIYRGWGWGDRVFVWHEAADTRLFHPPTTETERTGAVWIGNWGDGERTAELEDFLLRPTAELGLPLTIHGVRYPPKPTRCSPATAPTTAAGSPTTAPPKSSPSIC